MSLSNLESEKFILEIFQVQIVLTLLYAYIITNHEQQIGNKKQYQNSCAMHSIVEMKKKFYINNKYKLII